MAASIGEQLRLAREERQPTLIEALTYRFRGHSAADPEVYRTKEEVEEWRKKDPIDRQETRLREVGVDTLAIREEVAAAIEEGTQEALANPMPDPATATDRLFHDGDEPILLGDGNAPWSGFAERDRASQGADLSAGGDR